MQSVEKSGASGGQRRRREPGGQKREPKEFDKRGAPIRLSSHHGRGPAVITQLPSLREIQRCLCVGPVIVETGFGVGKCADNRRQNQRRTYNPISRIVTSWGQQGLPD